MEEEIRDTLQGEVEELEGTRGEVREAREILKGIEEELKGIRGELQESREEFRGMKEELEETREILKGKERELETTQKTLERKEEELKRTQENLEESTRTQKITSAIFFESPETLLHSWRLSEISALKNFTEQELKDLAVMKALSLLRMRPISVKEVTAFQILADEKLGEGGFGAVYKGTEPKKNSEIF
jgi:chromosome segregation ATPase